MSAVKIMGILNITPDSFSDGGLFFGDADKAVSGAKSILDEGATIIDIGGESSRPGSQPISSEEEITRVVPIIEQIREKLGFNFDISVDTYKSAVAHEALEAGATMVNSMGGFSIDPELAAVVSEHNCPVVIYHIKGTPQTMQTGVIEYEDVIKEISVFFEEQISVGLRQGIKKEQYILDPGIGFGKTTEHNLEIIKKLKKFDCFSLPLLIGVSRKGHLGKILQEKLDLDSLPEPTERLEASLAEAAVAVMHGASIVRTHDVSETKKFMTILEEFI